MTTVISQSGHYKTTSLFGGQRGYQQSMAETIRYLSGRLVSFDRIHQEQPLVAQAVRVLAPQIARIPWRAYQEETRPAPEGGNGRSRRVRVPLNSGDHEFARLLAKPAPRRSPLDLKNDIQTGNMVHGNHLERWLRPRRGRSELRRLEWRYMTAWTHNRQVVSWRYEPPDGDAEDLGVEEVIHWRWQAADGPFGVSPLAQLGVTLVSDAAMRDYSEASYKNGARIGTAVILDPKAKYTPEVKALIREEMHQDYTLNNAFSSGVFGGGVTEVKPFGQQTAVEAELISGRQLNKGEVGGVYGISEPCYGIFDNVRISDLDQISQMLFKHTTPPWTELMTQTLTAQMVESPAGWPDSGLYASWRMQQVLRGDPAARISAAAEATGTGLLTLNEWRDDDDREPYDDPIADLPLLPSGGLAPASIATRGPDQQAPDPKAPPEVE